MRSASSASFSHDCARVAQSGRSCSCSAASTMRRQSSALVRYTSMELITTSRRYERYGQTLLRYATRYATDTRLHYPQKSRQSCDKIEAKARPNRRTLAYPFLPCDSKDTDEERSCYS